MRKLFLILPILILVNLLPTQLTYGANPNRVKYSIGNKLYNYHSLNNTKFTYVNVNGPGKLTVMFRAHFTSDSPQSLSYNIIYMADSAKIKVLKVNNVLPTTKNTYIQSSDDKPSDAKILVIGVKPDVKRIGCKTKDLSPQVDFIYKFEPTTVMPWRDLKSRNDSIKIGLKSVSKPSVQSYYRISSSKSQKFKVRGPATIRVFTRLEYDYTMQGLLTYRVSVKKNDSIPQTFRLTTNPSRDMQYVSDKKFVPGQLQKFFIEVPKGVHTYETSLLDRHFSSLIRVSKQEKKR